METLTEDSISSIYRMVLDMLRRSTLARMLSLLRSPLRPILPALLAKSTTRRCSDSCRRYRELREPMPGTASALRLQATSRSISRPFWAALEASRLRSLLPSKDSTAPRMAHRLLLDPMAPIPATRQPRLRCKTSWLSWLDTGSDIGAPATMGIFLFGARRHDMASAKEPGKDAHSETWERTVMRDFVAGVAGSRMHY